MKHEEYLEKVVRHLESSNFTTKFRGGRAGNSAERQFRRLHHAILGIADEAGELIKILKAAEFYNRPIVMNDLEEELGDVYWYLTLAIDAIHSNLDTIRIKNVDKLLKKRYGGAFSEDAANNRNIAEEAEAFDRGDESWLPDVS